MKKFRILLVIVIALLSFQSMPAYAQENTVKVYLDSALMEFDVQPEIVNGRTLVPLRFISEKLGAVVTWDNKTQTATLVKDSDTIVIKIGSSDMTVDQSAVTLDVAPVIVKNRTLVPLRAIAEAFHITVDWDKENYAVRITSNHGDLFGTYTEKKFSLLNNRLYANLPDFAQDQAMRNGIMSPYSSSDEQTRIIIEQNGQKLVLYAAELFMQASDNITNDAKEVLMTENGSTGTLQPQVINGNIASVMLVPNTFEGTDGITIRAAIIKTQDNLLVYAAVLATPETFNGSKENCAKMAENIIGSISSGERQISRSPHTESISNFKISLAQDYILTHQMGVDFDVYYIQKIVKAGDPQPSTGIYFGNWPSYSESPGAVLVDDKILGQNIKWRYYNKNANTIDADSRMETLITLNQDFPMYIHIFANPRTEAAWNELKQMAESLSVAK